MSKKEEMSLLASIDMGTNTFRLLVAEVENGVSFKEIYSENRTTRLGEGLAQNKRLIPAAVNRAISALSHFRSILKRYPVDDVVVIATSAVRKARNKEVFLKEVKERTGLDVEVISGETEALCTYRGVNIIFENEAGPMLVVDVGGGSTEFIGSEGGTPNFCLSSALGVVHLAERFLQSDPPASEELRALRGAIEAVIEPVAHRFPQRCRFVGTGGTATTLAAIDQGMTDYDPEKINRYPLSLATIKSIFERLSSMTLSERKVVPGLEEGREDILIPGALILLTVMEYFGYDPLYVSDYGLREGILIDRFLDAQSARPSRSSRSEESVKGGPSCRQ
ncbi:MAG: hypothetical protein ACE5HN_04480 [Nitrospiria bacterium]